MLMFLSFHYFTDVCNLNLNPCIKIQILMYLLTYIFQLVRTLLPAKPLHNIVILSKGMEVLNLFVNFCKSIWFLML